MTHLIVIQFCYVKLHRLKPFSKDFDQMIVVEKLKKADLQGNNLLQSGVKKNMLYFIEKLKGGGVAIKQTVKFISEFNFFFVLTS